MVEYYFQDQLRWSFGFENPNKAAALIASLLPLVWVIAQSEWRTRPLAVRWLLVLFGNGLLCAGWWLLFMTFSRGGIVAAVAAFLYIGWRQRKVLFVRKNRARLTIAIVTALAIAVLFAGTNAMERSTQWITKKEGSVGNRLELWRGGLRMIAAIPQGVGQGRSGLVYMQWFQPLESTEGYRTLVNSYLTFAVEQGVWVFWAVLFAGGLFWRVTNEATVERRTQGLVIGCRASILAFAVAGFFTTTMEDWRVWIPPGLAILALAIACRTPLTGLKGVMRRVFIRESTVAGAISTAICGMIFVIGLGIAKEAPERIVLHDGEIEITPRTDQEMRRYSVLLDERVIGEDYGKLLRRLALGLNSAIVVRDIGRWSPGTMRDGETLIAIGEAVGSLAQAFRGDLVLISPARMEPDGAEAVLREARSTLLFNPSFDEDGRVSCWKDAADRLGGDGVQQKELSGVGTEVGWAWEQVVEAMSGEKQKNQ